MTVTVFAVIPWRSAVPTSISSALDVQPERSTCAPASSSAPSSMSPGDAGDAVDVEDPAHADCLAIRAAIVPAPNPSSMFTTATPAAHEVSIASSALTPPNAAP